ncbi:hypothetical protein [Methanogenium organophilum]|uniref:DUF11 domain-containing protein n=1 Tax=Methanogenium organophilum TaxID=2199 RepID=A0A9X9S5U3_METOG|nr:hypothetical protein [Methanogenium organophilum]WAI02017.1 hypothetical protein OU421_03870 [Methanogenium organophilum]
MDDGWKILIGITLIFCIGINALIIIAGMDYPDGFRAAGIQITSSYQYNVTLTGTGTAENVTLMIPLPSAGGDSPVGDAILCGEGEGILADWTTEEVGTGDAVFLKVTAPSLSFADGPVIFGATVFTSSLIDTANPAEKTLLLRPKEDMTRESGVMQYTSSLYTTYEMPGTEGMGITVRLDGTNTWRYPVDSGNSFTDSLTLTEEPHGDGWQTADGTLTPAIGKYSVI